MKHFSWIITLPITLVVVTFAVINRGLVAVDLWPLPLSVETPLFVLVLGSALAGFLFGGLVMWWSAGRQRQKLRGLRREVDRLARRNRSLENASQPPATVPPGAGLPVTVQSGPQGDSGSARPAA